jgi:hypothetical protein
MAAKDTETKYDCIHLTLQFFEVLRYLTQFQEEMQRFNL